MKFGTEVGLKGRKVLGGGVDWYPQLCGYRMHKGSAGCLWSFSCTFWRKRYKLQGAPDLVRAGHILGPKSGSGRTWAPCPSGAMVTLIALELIKPKLYETIRIVSWLDFMTYTLTLMSSGVQKVASQVLEPQLCILEETL